LSFLTPPPFFSHPPLIYLSYTLSYPFSPTIPIKNVKNTMATDSDFTFDDYIMPTTYTTSSNKPDFGSSSFSAGVPGKLRKQ
jgi:hypothetical protein